MNYSALSDSALTDSQGESNYPPWLRYFGATTHRWCHLQRCADNRMATKWHHPFYLAYQNSASVRPISRSQHHQPTAQNGHLEGHIRAQKHAAGASIQGRIHVGRWGRRSV